MRFKFYWYKNDQCHRDGDFHANIYSNGKQCWYKNNEFHRDGNLPAIIEIIEDDNNNKKYKGMYIINGVKTRECELDEETYNICKYDPNRPQSSRHMFINIDIETI